MQVDRRMKPPPPALPMRAAFLVLAAGLLAGTLAWHLPMMLWDHIDLVPIYEAWQGGALGSSEFLRIHDGSHLHAAAYAVLLASTWLSGGQPWLDCVLSFCLLAAQAWLLMRIAADALGDEAGWWRYGLLLLALNPGHLVNLQWGWQVAVFISTLGAIIAIRLLTLPSLPAWANLLALAAATIGVLGFSTTLAAFPIAMMLVTLHPSLTWRQRVAHGLPWLAAAVALSWWLAAGRQAGAPSVPGVMALVSYVLNYLGAGVSRLATGLAPAWALVALATAAWVAIRHRDRGLLPWYALMLFGVGCAVLTALGRAVEYGADHAFVSRYVSFSSLFWFGWLGAMLSASGASPATSRRWMAPVLAMMLLFLVANGIHMIRQAMQVHARAVGYAAHIRESYPAVDDAVLDAAFGWRAAEAVERLGRLQARGFAPFDRQPAETAEP